MIRRRRDDCVEGQYAASLPLIDPAYGTVFTEDAEEVLAPLHGERDRNPHAVPGGSERHAGVRPLDSESGFRSRPDRRQSEGSAEGQAEEQKGQSV